MKALNLVKLSKSPKIENEKIFMEFYNKNAIKGRLDLLT